MSDTLRFQLPVLSAAQAQKHITHNEALVKLDALAQLYLLSRTAGVPAPGGLNEGDCYLVPVGEDIADWSGAADKIAEWRDGAWVFHSPFSGLKAFVEDEAALLVKRASGWLQVFPQAPSDTDVVAQSASGAALSLSVREELLETLSGSFVESTIEIPNRAICFAVACRTITNVLGVTSYDCGLDGEPSKFGGSLGVSAGATNSGVIGPTAFYAPTTIRLSANGGSFSGGSVRIAVHFLEASVPAS
ncbi:MAG: DUF2793 domain-containing protein [Rhodobacteraceae bacterium]|nr:DUF2793 domain-containing protein [Paracoccaceae bacterium]